MIKGLKVRNLTWLYLCLLLIALMIGCTSREDPSEVLVLCGNHSCGDLVMVTTDTSSDGFQYLEPSLSPDGTQILFTADWGALPPDRPPDPPPVIRQIATIPVRNGDQPAENLYATGAQLVVLSLRLLDLGGTSQPWNANDFQKGGPLWYDDDSIICWIQTGRGNRLFQIDLMPGGQSPLDMLYREADDDLSTGQFWQHLSPALSPDKQWLAFSRFGFQYVDSLNSYTQQEIWVLSMATAGEQADNVAFPVTAPVSQIGFPAWSPDGSRLAFSASMDLVGQPGVTGTELYSVAFDTTGLAATGGVELNRDLRRLTFSRVTQGDPLSGVDNYSPVYTNDGEWIVFVSNRRAPSITLHDRNIWRIPADGRLDPELLFFSREDDVDPSIPPGSSNSMIISSAMGFPSQMLDRLEQEALIRIAEENPELSEPEVVILAAQERRELEFFARVMSHIFIFSNW